MTAPTIKRNAAKKPLISGRRPDMTRPFSMPGASIFLPFLPMLPVQVLTNHLLYDFSQTAIPTDTAIRCPSSWPR
ncbi:MAG: hypothetical protein CR217_13050 [Beijerinckiaceae bacterium]|nr:MAG: hypothetical protein CR217_13050 [Beijerinckiaceae bacterium]